MGVQSGHSAARHGVGLVSYPGGVPLLAQDLHIRVINASTGELLRELTLDPARNYQPTAGHQAGQRKNTADQT